MEINLLLDNGFSYTRDHKGQENKEVLSFFFRKSDVFITLDSADIEKLSIEDLFKLIDEEMSTKIEDVRDQTKAGLEL